MTPRYGANDPIRVRKVSSRSGKGKGKEIGNGKGKAKARTSTRRASPSPPKALASISKNLEDAADPHASCRNPYPSSNSMLQAQAPTLSFTAPTPTSEASTSGKKSKRRSISEPDMKPRPASMTAQASQHTRSPSSVSKGKRKAEEVEGTPPDHKKEMQRATFAADPRRELFPSRSVYLVYQVLVVDNASFSYVTNIPKLITTTLPRVHC